MIQSNQSIVIETKTHKCCRCGVMPEEFFYARSQKSRHGKPYTAYRCKKCAIDRRKQQYAKNPEAYHKITREWKRAHKERTNELVATSYAKNRAKFLANRKDKRREFRLEVLKQYSADLKCALCGESHDEFLVIDHINGGGTKHVEVTGRGGYFYRWLAKHDFPDGYRVLCHNCNFKELFRKNREAWESKVRTKTHKIRKIGDKVYPVDIRKLDLASFKSRAKIKLECFAHYSNSITPFCACCKITDIDMLSIDHINGGGREHKKKIKLDTISFFRLLRKNQYPTGYRILCHNCNFSFGLRQFCPHEEA